MGLLYYSKNDSKMQELVLPISCIGLARIYWKDTKELVETAIHTNTEPEWSTGSVPTYKWECGKYCNYSKICNSPLNKEYEGGKL